MTDNAFTAPQGVPAQLVAGDLWSWRADSLSATYPAATYALTYILAPVEGGATTTALAVADADGWGISVAAATTATLAAGSYTWAVIATRAADAARQTVATGTVQVLPDPTAATTADARTPARKMLDAVNSVLEGRITKDVEAYTIEGRSLTRVPFEVLRTTRARLMREVQAEDAAAAGKSTGPRYRKLRFGNG